MFEEIYTDSDLKFLFYLLMDFDYPNLGKVVKKTKLLRLYYFAPYRTSFSSVTL